MENKLKRLFDYQRFEKNPRLTKMLEDAERRCLLGGRELTEDELDQVSAAGDPSARMNKNPSYWTK